MKYFEVWGTALKVSGEGELDSSNSKRPENEFLESSWECICEERQRNSRAGATEERGQVVKKQRL